MWIKKMLVSEKKKMLIDWLKDLDAEHITTDADGDYHKIAKLDRRRFILQNLIKILELNSVDSGYFQKRKMEIMPKQLILDLFPEQQKLEIVRMFTS
jgi:hypothetical protein